MSLALCMIVKNEAARLPDCLKSVQGWVDEMVIVDTGSSDNTVEIARSFGAAVHHFAWTDDFAEARNYSLQKVESDWVLVLDADEVMLPDAIARLDAIMRSPNTLLITLLREEVGAKQGPLSLISRLFRNHPEIKFRRPYHELVDDSISSLQAQDSRWRVETLDIPAIRHFGYQEDVIQSQEKYERLQRLLAKAVRQYPEDAYLRSKLGGLQCDLKMYAQARTTLEAGLALVENEPAVRYELYYHLGLVCTAQGLVKEAETAYQQALGQSYPNLLKIGAVLNLGSLYLNHGAPELAFKQFKQGVRISPNLAIAHYNLGLALKGANRLSEAIAAYEQAIALSPNYAAAYQNLGVVYFKLGNIAESRQHFDQAVRLYQQVDPNQAAQLQQGMKELGIG
ncbi:MAG: glycosyltransferase [Cyanobacteria bacterium P01_F01_bin.42]